MDNIDIWSFWIIMVFLVPLAFVVAYLEPKFRKKDDIKQGFVTEDDDA